MENKLLIVTISPTPGVKLVSWPTSMVSIGNENFEETGSGDTNGFYDFLRLQDGHIVGVRFTPFMEHADLCDSATQGPGLRVVGVAPTVSIELYWGNDQGYVESLSGDQFMDYNYVFRSPAQRYAVTFGFSHLEEDEIKELMAGLPAATEQNGSSDETGKRGE
jgi:hypothetical protein